MDPQQQTVAPVEQPVQPKSNLLANIKKPYVAVILGVLLIFIFIFLFLKSGNKQEKNLAATTSQKKTTVKTALPKSIGSMKLETASLTVKKDQAVNFTLVADSNKYPVSGYDVLVAYDMTAFDFSKGKSLIKDFSVYTFKRSSHVTATGVKALQSKETTVFASTPVVELSFQPKKTGKYTFSVIKASGAEYTDIVTTSTKKMSPLVNAITVTVE